ncbi:MAG: hypothetical protein JWM62_1726 [Frankiales bacterium]|jgi:p-aminobenzoyl-glutamate transporter AbgT|nr:hypothetical protein [Frankiales bacterium]
MSRTSADDTRVTGGPFRRLYGASPWHLVALLACFALTAYAVSRLLEDLPVLLRIALWFVGAALVWDLVVGPALALADRLLRRLLGRRAGERQRLRVPALNYVRIPGLVSLLLLAVWLPVILQRSEQVFRSKAGLSQDPFLGRWVAITLVLFAASAVAYVVAVLRSRRRPSS